jgi:hypothetical protein
MLGLCSSFYGQMVYGWLVRRGEAGPGVGALYI